MKVEDFRNTIRQAAKCVYAIVSHPVGVLVITIALAVLFFLASRSTIDPRYNASKPKLLAQAGQATEKLTLLWDAKEVPNVFAVDVAMWNAGSKYLDQDMICDTAPIQIVPSADIRILQATVARTSRAGLRFATRILRDGAAEKSVVEINIEGDEALEKNDGGVFRIFFTGSEECEMSVVGRIKSCPRGFRRVKSEDRHRIGLAELIALSLSERVN